MAITARTPLEILDQVPNANNNYNPINPTYNAPTATTTPTTQSYVIPTANMAPVVPMQIAPPVVDTTNHAGTVTGIQTTVQSQQDAELARQTAIQEQAQTESQGMSNLITSLGLQEDQKAADKQQAMKDSGATDLAGKLNDLNAQIQNVQLDAQNANNTLESNAGGKDVTTAFLGGQQQEVNRQAAIKSLTLNSQYNILKGNYDTAKQNALDAVDLKYSVIENHIAVLKDQFDRNKEVLTQIDAKRTEALNAKIKKDEQDVADAKAKETAIQNIAFDVIKNGVTDPAVFSAIQGAKTIDEAIKLAAPSLKTVNTDIVKLDNGSTLLIDKKTGAIIKNYGGIKPTEGSTLTFTNDYNSYRNTAIQNGQIPLDAATYNEKVKSKNTALQTILGSGKFTKEQKADLVAAINGGQDAFSVIKNQAKNIMGQTLATSLDKYETAKEGLNTIDSLLDSYYANGGKTGIFTGNIEKTINNLGSVKDPKLVEIAVNIAAQLQIYRNAVSGTAYSVQEGKDIASIFPGINKSEGLNSAILDGRTKAFETTIDSQYRNTLGNTYDSLKTAEADVNKTSSQLLQEANQAKAQVNTFWQKSDGATHEMLMKLFNQGFNDIDVIEYLKAKKLI